MTIDGEAESKLCVCGFCLSWVCRNWCKFLEIYHNQWWNTGLQCDPKTKQKLSQWKTPSPLQPTKHA